MNAIIMRTGLISSQLGIKLVGHSDATLPVTNKLLVYRCRGFHNRWLLTFEAGILIATQLLVLHEFKQPSSKLPSRLVFQVIIHQVMLVVKIPANGRDKAPIPSGAGFCPPTV